ncbi:hypothetical protein F5050DRAFT_876371 [Lentinula boryana]|uniref:Uncharacterized protein n=1 Tax=Lentinula boryana TaxID=40481 RepID=A0ABQ8QMH7_9AGAR|nr:hypothetical protein F5050DRAFT_876371 [Lentinula boryana]
MKAIRISFEKADALSRNVHLDERGEPKIGGSVGGFIALVVSLILVIIIACTATFFLLRQETRDEETATRRRRRYRHQAAPPSSYVYDPSSTPSRSWFASLKDMLSGGIGSVSYNAARKMKAHDGWVQAGSGDEWDHDMRDVEQLRSMGHGDAQYGMAYFPQLDPPFRPPANLATESSYTVHSPSEPRTSQSPEPSSIPNRFASESSEPPTSSMHPFEIHAIPRSASPEAMISSQAPSSVYFESQNRKNSDISTRTFSSGTKFIEGL